jgi:hypothetical protein
MGGEQSAGCAARDPAGRTVLAIGHPAVQVVFFNTIGHLPPVAGTANELTFTFVLDPVLRLLWLNSS